MSKPTKAKHQRVRSIISLIAGIIVGVIFLIAASGKIFAFGEMPGQTMQFIGAILPDAWLTPGLAYFLGEIFFPYIIPWTELCLGVLLLVRVWPRFFAALTLPLIATLIANSAWYVIHGRAHLMIYGWESCYILTDIQALWVGITIFVLALTIVVIHPAGFFSSPPWSAKLGQGTKGKDKSGDPHYVKAN
jgi:uncharacterized membrane protein YphA (DoxX/SURF4 family)